MMPPPAFASPPEFRSRVQDPAFWRPYLAEIVERHRLPGSASEAVSGVGGTYPAFLFEGFVVKLFGAVGSWRQTHAAERAALALLAADPSIGTPQLLLAGELYPGAGAPWPYLVTSRMAGLPWASAGLSGTQKRTIASELGVRVRRIHALPPGASVARLEWPALDVAAAAARSSLPPHLVAQVDDFLTRLDPFDPVFVHGDLTTRHVFVESGRLAGIIDWGDARVADRHYELIQLHRDVFDCDRDLLRVFLAASDWPVRGSFARQALGLALHRQAIGRSEHLTMDVFEPVAQALPLAEIATLDELALALFGI
jgi:hygromycin-B 7''-O-kinase